MVAADFRESKSREPTSFSVSELSELILTARRLDDEEENVPSVDSVGLRFRKETRLSGCAEKRD